MRLVEWARTLILAILILFPERNKVGIIWRVLLQIQWKLWPADCVGHYVCISRIENLDIINFRLDAQICTFCSWLIHFLNWNECVCFDRVVDALLERSIILETKLSASVVRLVFLHKFADFFAHIGGFFLFCELCKFFIDATRRIFLVRLLLLILAPNFSLQLFDITFHDILAWVEIVAWRSLAGTTVTLIAFIITVNDRFPFIAMAQVETCLRPVEYGYRWHLARHNVSSPRFLILLELCW